MADFGRLDVVRIRTTWTPPEGRPRTRRGTGFVVRQGVVATALHVVADRSHKPPEFGAVELIFCRRGPDGRPEDVSVTAGVKPLSWPDDPQAEDWALLSFESDRDWPILAPRVQVDANVPFVSHGFAHKRGKGMNGTIVSCTTERNRQLLMELHVEQLQSVNPDDVAGYSGAPVMAGERVVGIIAMREYGPDEREHRNRVKGSTLHAIPISWLRDEHGQRLCPDELASHSLREAIKAEVIPLLVKSRVLTDKIITQFGCQVDHRFGAEHRADVAADTVCNAPELEPLLDAAEDALESGVQRADIRDFLRHTLRGCAEYVQFVERLRNHLEREDVAVLAFPVGTLPQVEIVMAASESRPVALGPSGRAGKSHVQVSDFRPDVVTGQGTQPGDAAFVSAVVTLANRCMSHAVEAHEVHAFLRNVRMKPSGWIRDADPLNGILRGLNLAMGKRKKQMRARRPPFYVAVKSKQEACLHIMKKYLPELRVGVLSDSIQSFESLNDIIVSLFAGE